MDDLREQGMLKCVGSTGASARFRLTIGLLYSFLKKVRLCLFLNWVMGQLTTCEQYYVQEKVPIRKLLIAFGLIIVRQPLTSPAFESYMLK